MRYSYPPRQGYRSTVYSVGAATFNNRKNAFAEWAGYFVTESDDGFGVEIGLGERFKYNTTVCV